MRTRVKLPNARALVGLGIVRDEVRGVLVVRGRIVRQARCAVSEERPMDAALDDVLSRLRQRWRPRPRVMAAVGPSSSQLRRLSRLPPISDEIALAEVIRVNAARFFIKNGAPLLTSAVRRSADDAVWAAAFDEPTIRVIADACRTQHLTLVAVMPASVALSRACRSSTFVCADGDAALVTECDAAGTIVHVRRVTAESLRQSAAVAADDLAPALRPLGESASRYADAFGATLVERSEPLAVRPDKRGPWRNAPIATWRLGLASLVLAGAVTFAVTAPVLAARRAGHDAALRLASINSRLRATRWMESELTQTTTALAFVGSFARTRRPVTQLLEELTDALPADASLSSLRIDAEGGSLVASAPRVANVLVELREVQQITDATIVGSISPDGSAAERAERATIRFRWRTADRSSVRATGDRRERR
jgi:hypothetical protein